MNYRGYRLIEELLQKLKMFGALQFYQTLKETDYDEKDLVFELLKSEHDWKSDKRKTRRLQVANFPFVREWAAIDKKANPKIPFEKIKKYSNGDFVNQKRNLCFIGSPGLGKTHSSVAIGRALCELGNTVRFYSANDLVVQLEEAQQANLLGKLMDKILSPDLLIIDELGFVPFSDNGARLLFDIFSKRYEQGSILITTNLDLPKWIQTFGSKELTKALIDRYTHKCDIFVFEGESYRFLESKNEKSHLKA
jgi:DNA replication protein DnaC